MSISGSYLSCIREQVIKGASKWRQYIYFNIIIMWFNFDFIYLIVDLYKSIDFSHVNR